jgi:hypothetical protein
MSAPEFKSLFDSPVFKHWFNKGLSKTTNGKGIGYDTFIHQTRDTSKKFIDNTMVDFVLSKERLSAMLGSVSANEIFSNVSSSGGGVFSSQGIEYSKSTSGQEVLTIKDLKFSTLNNTVSKILAGIANDPNIPDKLKSARTAQGIDRGHVFGFGNTLLMRTKDELSKVSSYDNSFSKEQLEALGNVMEALVDILEEYDISTSDIKDLGTDMYAKYRKTSNNWLIEWQATEDNSDSGRKVGRLLGRTNTSTLTGIRGVFTGKATAEVVSKFVQQFIDESVSAPDSSKLALLNQRASPSMKDMIVDKIMSTITGNRSNLSKEYSGGIKLPTIPILKVQGANKANSAIKKQKTEVKKLVKAIGIAKARLNYAAAPQQNLTSLQALLDRHLQDVISANMGDGSARNVLNYRTGRFAASAKVERLSQSRQGAITAFYTYAKNPYQTFQPGFAQGSPKTRDPKILISGSIREIAATIVGNNLRAVLI